MPIASMTPKGHIMFPVEVSTMDLRIGQQPGFVEGKSDPFLPQSTGRSVMEFYGAGKWMITSAPITVDQMNETILNGWAGLLKDQEFRL